MYDIESAITLNSVYISRNKTLIEIGF